MTDTRDYFRTNLELVADIGRGTQRLRLQRNLPQEELARQAGVSLGVVRQLEAGKDVRLSSLIAVLRALGELSGVVSWIPPDEPSPIEVADLGHARRKARRFAKKISSR